MIKEIENELRRFIDVDFVFVCASTALWLCSMALRTDRSLALMAQQSITMIFYHDVFVAILFRVLLWSNLGKLTVLWEI